MSLVQDKHAYPIKLGKSITDATANPWVHRTLKFMGKPQGLDENAPWQLNVDENTKHSEIILKSAIKSQGDARFEGPGFEDKSDEYILIFQKDHFILERVSQQLNQLRRVSVVALDKPVCASPRRKRRKTIKRIASQ